MKLRCIEKYFANVTYGKVYEVVKQDKSYTWIINDRGEEQSFDTIESYFEELPKLKKGDKVRCLYDRLPLHTLNNIYEVLDVNGGIFVITSDYGKNCEIWISSHHFELVTDSAPSYYNNDKGSLYKFAEDHGLNAYEFEIIKRVVRCRKKKEFVTDIEKTIFLLELYMKEQGEKYKNERENLN